eukprot:6860260-Prymnesium_polylepis.1
MSVQSAGQPETGNALGAKPPGAGQDTVMDVEEPTEEEYQARQQQRRRQKPCARIRWPAQKQA